MENKEGDNNFEGDNNLKLKSKIKDYQSFVDTIQYLEYKVKEIDTFIGEILIMKPDNVSLLSQIKQKEKLEEQIQEMKVVKERLKNEIYEECHHNWVEDHIDSLDGLRMIEYCEECHLNK